MLRICIIGAGISGLSAAHYLSDDQRHELTVFEANEEFGGRASVTGDGEHCTRLFLRDYAYLLQLLCEVPAENGSVHDGLEACRRFARTRGGAWIEIDHIYAFLSKTAGLSLRDKWDISKTNRESLLLAKKAQDKARGDALRQLAQRRNITDLADTNEPEDPASSLNVFAPIWNWSGKALLRAVRSARGSGATTYAFPGSTERYLTTPWVEYLKTRGVTFRSNAWVDHLRLDDHAVEISTRTSCDTFDVVLVTAFATDAYALLDRSGITRPLDHRGHTHCKCFTLDLDPREPIVNEPGVRIYSHGGMTTVVQPGESRCVTLATFPASTEQAVVLDDLCGKLGLKYEPLRVRCRTNLGSSEAVFVGSYVDAVTLAAPLRPIVYFAGSCHDNSYPLDSGEAAARSAYNAVRRMAADHPSVTIRSSTGLPEGTHEPDRLVPQRAHPNVLANPRRSRLLWRALCRASSLVARLTSELTFVDQAGTAYGSSGPAVYIANHRSIFDVPAGLLTFRRLGVFPHLVVATKYFDRPVVGLLRAVGAFPAIRGSTATVNAAVAAIEQGESVAFMVEGRILTREETATAAYGRGAALTAARAGVPIVPLASSGTDRVWSTSRPRPIYRRRSKRPAVVVAIGEPIDPRGLSPQELDERIRISLRDLEEIAYDRAGGAGVSPAQLAAA